MLTDDADDNDDGDDNDDKNLDEAQHDVRVGQNYAVCRTTSRT